MAKKVAYITIHVGTNFGSVLQTIATSVVLKEIGCKPVCINYIPPRVSHRRRNTDLRISLPRRLFRFIWKIYTIPLRHLNKKAYSDYLSKYCELTLPIYDEDTFVEKCPVADVYMTGSDQVWNIKHNEGLDTHYFFDGIKGRKISFASSIGYTDIGEENKRAYKRFLADYCKISVREDSAVELLRDLGYEAMQLLDPVFMLDKNEWWNYVPKKNIVKEPYLLIYTPYNTVDKSVIYKHARHIAKKEGLKIVTFSWTYYKDKDADKTVLFASPGDFLDLVMGAEYVITNSFHGTAFSIDLNKMFWAFLPSGFTTRITSVLSKFGLSDRLIAECDVSDNWDYRKSIDFNAVNTMLQQEREKSMSYLKEAIL